MSVDIGWDKVTSGPDGAALADKIRDFVHQKFQQVALPRFINAVHVHAFEFGHTCPEIEIKDICDPLPDFYDDEDDDDDSDVDHDELRDSHATLGRDAASGPLRSLHDYGLSESAVSSTDRSHIRPELPPTHPAPDLPNLRIPGPAKDLAPLSADLSAGPFPRSTTPGIPGGTSNLNYFHFPGGGGLSGTQTPLAAVASGTPFSPRSWSHDLVPDPAAPAATTAGPGLGPPTMQLPQSSTAHGEGVLCTRPSTGDSISSSRESESGLSSPRLQHTSHPPFAPDGQDFALDAVASLGPLPREAPNRQPSDLQVVARVRYSGDVRMTLTAEILLDYPMPSFVGIPLKLAITGLTFDGVALVAWIRRKLHFCFLDPEDASTLVGDSVAPTLPDKGKDAVKNSLPGLLQQIHVESEIGRQEDGKQVLKNVGKVEKFVIEQMRKIFEEEFVFPSYWTFLV